MEYFSDRLKQQPLTHQEAIDRLGKTGKPVWGGGSVVLLTAKGDGGTLYRFDGHWLPKVSAEEALGKLG